MSSGVRLEGSPPLIVDNPQGNNQKAKSKSKLWTLAAVAIGLVASTYALMSGSSQPVSMLDRGIQDIQRCPAAKQLWDSNLERGPFTVQYGDVLSALVYPETREILISKSTKEESEMVDSLVFELFNLEKSDEFSEIHRKICSTSADDYARKIETLEYKTIVDTHAIQQKCVQDGFWLQSFVKLPELFESKWSSLGSYLKDQEEGMHTDSYRLEWHKDCATPEKALSFQLEMIEKSQQIIEELLAAEKGN